MTRSGLEAHLARLENRAEMESRQVADRLRGLRGRPSAGWKPLATAVLFRKMIGVAAGASRLPGPIRALLLARIGLAAWRRFSRGGSVARR